MRLHRLYLAAQHMHYRVSIQHYHLLLVVTRYIYPHIGDSTYSKFCTCCTLHKILQYISYNSMVMFAAAAAAVWTSLFAISHNKVITVNNEGNNNTNCCAHGRCPCGSLSNALQYLESHSIISITSQSVPLHGLKRIRYLNNITISGNGATVMCNNSGIVYILYCRNVVIQGIIWDQCGDTDQPDSAGIGFRDISNLAILSSTFQHSGACIAVFLSIKSGYVEVKNSNFLSNHVVNPSRCQWYSSLFSIVENKFYRMDNFTITDTIFHYNGDFNSTTHRNNSVLYVYFWQYHQINIYFKNSTNPLVEVWVPLFHATLLEL